MNKLPKARTSEIVVQNLHGEVLIYDLKVNQAYCLNEPCAIIYQLCDGTKSVAEIAGLTSVKLKTLVSEDFVRLTLNELTRKSFLENDSETERFLNSVSRRELVKKVGLASIVTLPVITGLVAPKAADAASGTPSAAVCTTGIGAGYLGDSCFCINNVGVGNSCGQGTVGAPCQGACRCVATSCPGSFCQGSCQ